VGQPAKLELVQTLKALGLAVPPGGRRCARIRSSSDAGRARRWRRCGSDSL